MQPLTTRCIAIPHNNEHSYFIHAYTLYTLCLCLCSSVLHASQCPLRNVSVLVPAALSPESPDSPYLDTIACAAQTKAMRKLVKMSIERLERANKALDLLKTELQGSDSSGGLNCGLKSSLNQCQLQVKPGPWPGFVFCSPFIKGATCIQA